MTRRIKYAIAYMITGFVAFSLMSIIDRAFDIRALNLGLVETILASLGTGIFIALVFGLIFEVNPWKFPWEWFQ